MNAVKGGREGKIEMVEAYRRFLRFIFHIKNRRKHGICLAAKGGKGNFSNQCPRRQKQMMKIRQKGDRGEKHLCCGELRTNARFMS